MRRSLLISLALSALTACGGGQNAAPPQPSVAVTTVPVKQGTLPETVTAYGTASPALPGVQTISFAQPGQVTALMVTPGLAVNAGQPLLTFTPAAAVRSTYQMALNALQAAQVQESSTRQLLAQKLATADQMAQAQKAVADARATLQGLSADGAARASTTVTAPFDGVIATLTVAQGDRSQSGAPLLTVARRDALIISAGVDPAMRASIAVGQDVAVQRLTGGAPVPGHVLRVADALNPKTRLVDVDIAFSAGALMPGEAVVARIATRPVHGWVVPHASVVTADGAPHVFQDKGGKARQIPVTVMLSSESGDVVSGSLDPALPLIVDGAYQAHDGDSLRRGQ